MIEVLKEMLIRKKSLEENRSVRQTGENINILNLDDGVL